ncbi:hypothetical protein BDY19DRAFT_912080 [Irpex rosettiformis]|uniref:Uncharacterized protein n=1 Tax=Irpex rosettiformis TaxID=378272 RepID=A0ACB8UJR2_9APHY|nr:hypothetical protein BDY19DRAFT_912080 [Irpex rosettiformis]
MLSDMANMQLEESSCADSPVGLSGLPDELFIQIAEILYSEEQKTPLVNLKFRVTWVLSLVNRRWRRIMLPLLFRSLAYKRPYSFERSLERFLTGGSNEPLAHAVKSIRIEISGKFLYKSRLGVLSEDSVALPFKNLEEFECPATTSEQSIYTALSDCSQLLSLALVCDDEWPKVLLGHLAKLTTLRLYADGPNRGRIRFPLDLLVLDPQPTPYASITTLTLHSRTGISLLVDDCLSKCSFPNLQVFTIQECSVLPLNVFQFIHQHPTLLEVNARIISYRKICLEAVRKLIDGTGTWFDPSKFPSTDDTEVEYRYHGNFISQWPPHDSIFDTHASVNAFAFTRTILDPCRPVWQSHMGSLKPRYTCTALALHGFNVLHDPEGPGAVAVAGALRRLFSVFPHIQELRLQIEELLLRIGDRMEWIIELRTSLQLLPMLRKLALHWWVLMNNYEHRWGKIEDLKGLDRGLDFTEDYIPFLDDAVPLLSTPSRANVYQPPSLHSLTIMPAPEEEMHPNWCGMDAFKTSIRKVLRLEEEEELDEFDESLVMRAWQVRNEEFASRIVRLLAQSCPLLESFDWYFSDAASRHRHLPCTTIVWNWKIRRNTCYWGSIQPSGNLKYTGSLQGSPPSLSPLVGQELEYSLRRGNVL